VQHEPSGQKTRKLDPFTKPFQAMRSRRGYQTIY